MSDGTREFIDPVEDCPWRSPREILARSGYIPLPPNELSDQQLAGRLWELLYAAAAARFFFCSTNHLSDREMYLLLWEDWLDIPTADIPPEAETNNMTVLSDFNAGGMTHEEIWLRYYATEDDQDLWRSAEPQFVFPPHQDPPFDRDRFLPSAPASLDAHTEEMPGEEELLDDDDETDPLGLGEVDRQIAAAKSNDDANGEGIDPEDDSEIDPHIEAAEPENWAPPARELAAQHVPLLPPAEITEEMLVPILWELLHNLALRGFYVLHTNHLTDHQLYGELWERGLRDPAHLPGRSQRGGWFHDVLGSWGDDEMQIWLRYYASEADRAKHALEYPADTIPPKEKPTANRDWRLPKSPIG